MRLHEEAISQFRRSTDLEVPSEDALVSLTHAKAEIVLIFRFTFCRTVPTVSSFVSSLGFGQSSSHFRMPPGDPQPLPVIPSEDRRETQVFHQITALTCLICAGTFTNQRLRKLRLVFNRHDSGIVIRNQHLNKCSEQIGLTLFQQLKLSVFGG